MLPFRFFERLLEPTVGSPDAAPPGGQTAFYWHYVRQARWLDFALFFYGAEKALVDLIVPVFIGHVVNLVTNYTPAEVLRDNWPELAGMAVILLFVRPALSVVQELLTNQSIAAGLSNLIRWQSHWHVVRQGWTFFQNDFAGRIANRIMQTGPSVRESVVQAANAVWYIVVYGGSAIALLGNMEPRLAAPLVVWIVGYLALMRYFVPRLRNLAHAVSDAKS
ncbi:MAG: ABC transporter transmembrane domain-containing protein, partial [Rhodospirillaceae bacterium]